MMTDLKPAARRVAVLLALGVGATGAAAQTSLPVVDLITHNQIEIGRPAETIWPLIVDPSKWKQGARLEHRAGPVGSVGEIFAALGPNGEATFFVENVELVPGRRRTIKLSQPDGVLIGYATWWLSPTTAGSIVGYDVYSELALPAGTPIAPAEIARQRSQAEVVNGQRFDAELAALKRLVEGR